MKLSLILGMVCLPVVAAMAEPASNPTALKVGDKAPDFVMRGSDGKDHALKDYKGKSWVLVAWFPKAFTGGCTAECKSMGASTAELDRFRIAYFTASVDDADTNKKFAESLSLKYAILSDPEKKAATAYGVLNPARGFAQRWTYIIDDQGIIRAIDTQVNTANYGPDLVKKLEELGVPKK